MPFLGESERAGGEARGNGGPLITKSDTPTETFNGGCGEDQARLCPWKSRLSMSPKTSWTP